MNAKANPKEAWCVVSALQSCLRDGKHGLSNIPGLIVRICQQGLWREFYCEPIYQTVSFKSFEDYVKDPVPSGLGTDIQTLKDLCSHHADALDVIDKALQRKPGGGKNQHTKGECLFDNIKQAEAPTGTSKDYALRRLRKDRPDLHGEVLEGVKSAHAAMVEAGFRKRQTPDEAVVKTFRKVEQKLEVVRQILAQLEPHEKAVVCQWLTEAVQ
jgi:hypothetical protein